jgi:hypothetical protein
MRTLLLVTMIFAAACGGDDGGSAGDDGNGSGSDAGPGPGSDAGPAAKQVGTACTPDMSDPPGAGDCGAGFTCLALEGGHGSFCTKTCTADTTGNAACNAAFTGPGISSCLLSVMPSGGGTATNYCGIVCSTTNTAQCPDCNGTCPAPLTCSAPLMGTGGTTVGMACQ